MAHFEAIVTCANYGDYLAETLPHTLQHFDRVLVVTSPQDVETQELCRRLSVPYYASDVFFQDGGKFNKARGIDFGVGFVRYNEWIVQLDADTWLPPTTRRMLDLIPLDEECIYGIDRVDCVGWDAWKAFLSGGHLGHDYMCRTPVPGNRKFPLLDRIAIKDYQGWTPIGYFQMWHGKHQRRYPIAKGDAEHTDVLHAIQWPRAKRVLIPEIIGVHLQAQPAPLGANWKGRTTPRFCAPKKDEKGNPTPAPKAPTGESVSPDVKPVIYMG